jgi:hypothetical protein
VEGRRTIFEINKPAKKIYEAKMRLFLDSKCCFVKEKEETKPPVILLTSSACHPKVTENFSVQKPHT